jgi:hypothetical protein
MHTGEHGARNMFLALRLQDTQHLQIRRHPLDARQAGLPRPGRVPEQGFWKGGFRSRRNRRQCAGAKRFGTRGGFHVWCRYGEMIYRDFDTDIKFANETSANFGRQRPAGIFDSGLNDSFSIVYWISMYFKSA